MRAGVSAGAPGKHIVQFYESEAFLIDRVSSFTRTGLAAGERVLLIATPDHLSALLQQVSPPADVLAQGQLVVCDAELLLAELMAGETPDAAPLRALVAELRRGQPRLRVYGELVDLLWRRGQAAAALALEALWSDVLASCECELLCSYWVRGSGAEADDSGIQRICDCHSVVLPSERVREVKGPTPGPAARPLADKQREVEAALAAALAQQRELEAQLRAAHARERALEERLQTFEHLESELVRMIGHDLRAPLHMILSTLRVLTLHDEPFIGIEPRLGRMITSAERMQRMIDQLVELIELRCADGLVLDHPREHDLGLLVYSVADQVRVAHPLIVIEVESRGPSLVRLDANRFEQVLVRLIGNAAVHGDPDRVITVRLNRDAEALQLCVHNYGPAIAPERLGRLFEADAQVSAFTAGAEGLGLGLFLSRRVVEAHGGTLEASSDGGGTRFVVTLPAGTSPT